MSFSGECCGLTALLSLSGSSLQASCFGAFVHAQSPERRELEDRAGKALLMMRLHRIWIVFEFAERHWNTSIALGGRAMPALNRPRDI